MQINFNAFISVVFYAKQKCYMLHQTDAADADDGHKSMWLKSSADKVIEADLHFMLRCFDYGL